MNLNLGAFRSTAVWVALAAGLSAQALQPGEQPPSEGQQPPTFRVQIDAVSMDVIVKDSQGRFVADLQEDEFEIFEDGVKQEITSMTMSHGGRVTNVLEPPPPTMPEGVILPPRRVVNDTSGRIFLFFVDDLHLRFQQTGRVRAIFKKISKLLVHDGDLFSVVSSGPSSIAIEMTYDKGRLDDAIKKITGDGLRPSQIIMTGSLQELRYRAQVSLLTMRMALKNLEKITNRRKALVWVSPGYDFNPFQESRYGIGRPRGLNLQSARNRRINEAIADPDDPQPSSVLRRGELQSETFVDADLAFEMAEITRAANRANTTIYPIDPRGLMAGQDIDEPIDPQEWAEHVRKTQHTLRVLAEETGGLAIVNQNGFDSALKRIDAESSDYYVLGYYSNNSDPSKRRRRIDVKVKRDGVEVYSRKEYEFEAPRPPVSVTKP